MRAANIKKGYDWRDTNHRGTEERCKFCEKRDAISEKEAGESGLNWEEYTSHPKGYRTCWACKNSKDSVMTEKQALQKWKAFLKAEAVGRYGKFNPIFYQLKQAQKIFHHKPVTNGPSKNSKYYWVPDLREEAEKRGWKPQGEKRSAEQAHPCPTPKKNRQTDALVCSPAATQEHSSPATVPQALPSTAKTKRAPRAQAEPTLGAECQRAEMVLLGEKQSGAIKARVERLEQECFGELQTGSLKARVRKILSQAGA
eukprot:2640609-Rhodomonas_salina.2